MNSVIELSGRFDSMSNDSRIGPLTLPKNKSLSCEKVSELRDQLLNIRMNSKQKKLINGFLITVVCERVLPKSKRIKRLFSIASKEPADNHIRGVVFRGGCHKKHVFIYFLRSEIIDRAIQRLENLCQALACFPDRKITKEQFDRVASPGKNTEGKVVESMNLTNFNLSKTEFCQLVCDLIHIERFEEYKGGGISSIQNEPMLIQLIETGRELNEILKDIGIESYPISKDQRTFFLGTKEIKGLLKNAPFLVSMSVSDKCEGVKIGGTLLGGLSPYIPKPKQEPIVGVIDTAFDDRAYFHEWVTYEDRLDYPIDLDQSKAKEAQDHGTKVSSIIVDGPALNPDLEDGCGRFRVCQFRLMNGPTEASSIATILRKLEDIIEENRNIRVWNFSFGAREEIEENYISVIGAELDRLQYKYDVIFVISGSNATMSGNPLKLGAPADSLNALVVNSVNANGEAASYSRRGPVLSFFTKPDISYFGGDVDRKINVWGCKGLEADQGTSFAAAWISRKVAFLIYYMNLPREVAKAILIDSAAGWRTTDFDRNQIGFGVVPIRVEEVLQSQEDEIRFILSGTCTAYDTYTYKLPVPLVDSKYPYYARATLCYFPEGERWQGVDYTQTELDLHFGRLIKKSRRDPKTNKIRTTVGIKSINNNTQGEFLLGYHLEEDARMLYRKWDNVKRVVELIKTRRCPREVLNEDNPQWGISILTKERQGSARKHNLRFGVVVTLKEMFGKNRVNTFVRNCQALGWTVNVIDIEARMKMHIESNIEINWELG